MIIHHNHDNDQVVIGCPACIAAVRAQEEAARWAEAPVRLVEFECSYDDGTESDVLARLSFELELGIPPDAKDIEIETQYASDIGYSFAFMLPDSVSMDDTDYACETMEVETVTIGALVAPQETVPDDQPSLFEEA